MITYFRTPLEIFLLVCVIMFILAVIAGGGLYNAKAELYYHSPAWRIIRDQSLHPTNDDSTVTSAADQSDVYRPPQLHNDDEAAKGLLSDHKNKDQQHSIIGTNSSKDDVDEGIYVCYNHIGTCKYIY
jgi:hypothetical protein